MNVIVVTARDKEGTLVGHTIPMPQGSDLEHQPDYVSDVQHAWINGFVEKYGYEPIGFNLSIKEIGETE